MHLAGHAQTHAGRLVAIWLARLTHAVADVDGLHLADVPRPLQRHVEQLWVRLLHTDLLARQHKVKVAVEACCQGDRRRPRAGTPSERKSNDGCQDKSSRVLGSGAVVSLCHRCDIAQHGGSKRCRVARVRGTLPPQDGRDSAHGPGKAWRRQAGMMPPTRC